MKKQLVTALPSQEPASLLKPLTEEPRKGLLASWRDFWFSPTDPIGLHLIRFFAGVLFFFWLASLAGYQAEFFGTHGWFDLKAQAEAKKLQDQPMPQLYWSPFYLLGKDTRLINAFYGVSLGVFALFALGIATRLTAPLTWAIVCSYLVNPAILYEADYLLVVLAFYLMAGYLLLGLWNGPKSVLAYLFGSSDSLLWKSVGRLARGERSGPPSYSANLALRLLQVHFALAIVVSALHKLQFGDWWGGMAFFYPLHPPLETTQEQIRSEMASASTWFFLLSLGQYLLLLWQLAFPLFAWRRAWRPVLIGGAIVGWIGSDYLYKLPLFGPIFLIACLSFVTVEEWHFLGKVLRFLGGLLFRKKAAVPEQPLPGRLQPQRV